MERGNPNTKSAPNRLEELAFWIRKKGALTVALTTVAYLNIIIPRQDFSHFNLHI
jgi:hypothetical protein